MNVMRPVEIEATFTFYKTQSEKESKMPMETVKLPGRKTKPPKYNAEQVKDALTRLSRIKPGSGEGIAINKDKWYDTEAKARAEARAMAELIVEHPDAPEGMLVPKTHVMPSKDGTQFTPLISPRAAKS